MSELRLFPTQWHVLILCIHILTFGMGYSNCCVLGVILSECYTLFCEVMVFARHWNSTNYLLCGDVIVQLGMIQCTFNPPFSFFFLFFFNCHSTATIATGITLKFVRYPYYIIG